jgi:hypothetical protein
MVIVFALTSVLTGCSHGIGTNALHPSPAREDQFISEVSKLPPPQRDAYVAAHQSDMNLLRVDPDRSRMNRLIALFPRRIP